MNFFIKIGIIEFFDLKCNNFATVSCVASKYAPILKYDVVSTLYNTFKSEDDDIQTINTVENHRVNASSDMIETINRGKT